jgi:hypothetical protein
MMARHVIRATSQPPAMTFNEVTKAVAKLATEAVNITVENFQKRYVYDEDDMTGFLFGSLQTKFHGTQIGEINLDASVLRHRRGIAAEEREYGADLLIHVTMDTPTQKYSKGVLIQAKKSEPEDYWSERKRGILVEQCNKMLEVTPAALY